ncbi:TetR/AcrR family transcriptional regulator [Kribbella sandramycini]|uniref:TetR/AcrR family transcriptional regulator n=1 Tax=Kribbella sandramycini TaxID=60450 RepID=A0A7Y4KWB0_9ACTN|nr:TetR/AcrR family transcriptional regulator [Kribbella sandramycini]MBB6567623.1 TetR/AcrR family transcriptional repressor of nem operon [Kribbella sandramycini]NOL39774.1 TetR/AcrR family transcriptional regulator [Kribbella sandramycini]
MGRASKAEMAQHRADVVQATARLVRERGSAGVSVQDVMSEAGLTHGGFYKHFGSKDELIGIAATEAFDEVLVRLADAIAAPDGRAQVLQEYLSIEHRDDPGQGCACTALADDSIHAGPGSPIRTAYIEGVDKTLEAFRAFEPGTDTRRRAIADLATLVGAVTLARATSGTLLSEEILGTVLDELTERVSPA